MTEQNKNPYLKQLKESILFLTNQLSEIPRVGIIQGTGLGKIADEMVVHKEISYRDIPHFPDSTVESHAGKLVFGILEGKQVVVMKGRYHYYEGYDMKTVTFPVRVMKGLGIEHLFISNAAGGLNPAHAIGDCMVIEDHIDLFPENPLRGRNLDNLGVRFPDMSEPYSLKLINQAKKISSAHHLPLQYGVYVGLQGPNLETKAEYKYLRAIGADAVGMSTVPEVIVARHMDIPVFAISAITDLCSPHKVKKISIAEVIEAASMAEPTMTRLIRLLIQQLP
ncbi:MAG TPA: purine-nucleoside phosphorylase [Lunatimonas sp.]|nr:purine-nucleoside phosphorylase [Lunatimonas sp.]